MGDQVKWLRDANTQPDADVIEALEHALASARDGRLRSVYIAGSLIGNEVYSNFTSADMVEGLGLLSVLQARLHRRLFPE